MDLAVAYGGECQLDWTSAAERMMAAVLSIHTGDGTIEAAQDAMKDFWRLDAQAQATMAHDPLKVFQHLGGAPMAIEIIRKLRDAKAASEAGDEAGVLDALNWFMTKGNHDG